MYAFKAYFWNDTVCINGKKRYRSNEILNQCLNMDFSKLEKIRDELATLRQKLILQDDAALDYIRQYDRHAQRAQRLVHLVDELLRSISLYAENMDAELLNGDKLFDYLNAAYPYWGDDDEEDDSDSSDESDYGFETGDGKDSFFYHTRFFPRYLDMQVDDPNILLEIEDANRKIGAFFDRYLTFIDDLLRVKHVYCEFLDHFLHVKNNFLNAHETAEAYQSFIEKSADRIKGYQKLDTSGPVSMSHAVLMDEKGRAVLCEEYSFRTLGAFLYLDFFRGLKIGYLPKRCLHCGRYFLLQGGKYSDYCERPLEEDNTKTCRDVGARKKYDDKCKTDPVWLTYNRAYKTHYARHMKRKMSAAEFEQWSRYAVELRAKALSSELTFEEYQQKIKE
ncbi:DUF6076 domain-containing protein [Ethanoligenens harbinense]|uniref:Uncharacterized protein n=1 Tax=Ethanoligenens harbinense (strain DSM 18485 / JCM 12961 / CGMCC 1.5033 / YUAN-3) TaxID=663278 RepID=E6U9N6_ETHHY|nr:DUF6076 domain-containing protein [Ethanoligenens harbinense]ADU27322.1 hypothetical protein Ethha_1797 [Ethanoligenens harbinense YUAN-3]AVQ96387.1 hypothetical protein CXQ68_09215 [Ethanoligenens harbinense YUAN-3]AYF39045.1 hypothetical protein CXP51_09085 [Ethanoligenens harbinense]AYF41871.1 hypothetical protein CN246_09655 [Ethanoligenens harbinense]QCN92628.1 hypothetical protein DRA42_09245 [Ethanoligenens harbinense]